MSVQIYNIFLCTFLVVLCDFTSAQYCAKVDFNRTTLSFFPEFRECQKKNIPVFAIKDYATSKDVKPYRANAKYFLSNDFLDYSCIESNMRLTLNATSTIEAAVYLKSAGYSVLEIIIYDLDRPDFRVDVLRTEGTAAWTVLRTNSSKTVSNAGIEIVAYMSAQSVIGIEYIHILNSAMKAPDCTSAAITPKPPTPGASAEPATPLWAWIVIGSCLAIIFIIIIFLVVYCIVDSRRSRSHDCANK